MHQRHFTALTLLAAALAVGAAAVQPAAAAPEQAASTATARVWFLWPSNSQIGYDVGATPTVYANGAPIAAINAGTEFYRDFPPGTYSFTVDPYGLPTGHADAVQLLPGTQTFLEVQWAPTWQEGYAPGRGMTGYSFFVLTMSPQLAQAYLPTLTNLGAR